MGEITEVDLAELRAVADSVCAGAARIDEIRPQIPVLDDLPGAAVERAAALTPLWTQLTDVVGELVGWAAAARAAADAFGCADQDSGDRMHLR